jgi:4-methyl-5(b-hydroxyethyl)-thiazole monophosphate biosynthesis
MTKRVIVPLADGFEEIEAVTIIDVLRRAGIEVVTAALDKKNVKGANGIAILADNHIDDLNSDTFDMVVLPGGVAGAEALRDSTSVINIIRGFNEREKLVGAICAAPIALEKAGVIDGEFTCYPSFEEQVDSNGYTDQKKVVINDNVITSRGPATAICFALSIVQSLLGDKVYSDLKSGLLADYC